VWLGTAGLGLFRYRDGRFDQLRARDGLPSDFVVAVLEDRRGRLWVGTAGMGAAVREKGAWRKLGIADGLPDNYVVGFLEDRRGLVWIATGGGLAVWEEGQPVRALAPATACPTRASSPSRGRGRQPVDLHQPGLARRLPDGRFQSWTSREGLFQDALLRVLDDGRGSLWMTNARGSSACRSRSSSRWAEGRRRRVSSEVLGRADGMRSAECNGGLQDAGVVARDGRLWLPTVRGLAVVDPAGLPRNALPPPVVVEELLVDGQGVDLSGEVVVRRADDDWSCATPASACACPPG